MSNLSHESSQEGSAHLMEVTRTARYHTFGPLEGPLEELWYALHGYGQLAARFGHVCRGLATPKRLVVAPEGLSRFYLQGTDGQVGASWMTRDLRAREIDDTLGFLGALDEHLRGGDRRAARVQLLGFSQGGAAAARFCILGAIEVERLILWSAGFPPDLDQDLARKRLAGVRVTLVAGRSDPFLTEGRIAEEFERLEQVAPHAQLERFEGGHRIQRTLLHRLARE